MTWEIALGIFALFAFVVAIVKPIVSLTKAITTLNANCETLASQFKKFDKGKFILSYNDDEFIRELYKDFVIEEVERSDNLKMAMGEKGSRYKELIIRNF